MSPGTETEAAAAALPVELSVIVPVYNEAPDLWSMAEGLAPCLDETVGRGRWQFVLVDNGSADASPEIIGRIVTAWPGSLALRLDRPNYGEALAHGLRAATGEWAYVVNVDFWDDVLLRWCWRHRALYDLVLGSKRADPSLNRQHRYRQFLSWGLNCILQFAFGFVGTDTHGQKFLSLPAIRPILAECVLRRGQFDTELTLRAMRRGLWLAEVPVPITELRPPRNLMLGKITRNLADIVRLRRVVRRIPPDRPIRYHRWARVDLERENSPQAELLLAAAERGCGSVAAEPQELSVDAGGTTTRAAVAPSERAPHDALRAFYDAQYRERTESPRTSKGYALACLPNGGHLSVLDVGCGTGVNSEAIAARGHAVYGIDVSAAAIETYRERGFEGRAMDVDAGLDFAAGTFDLVFCSEVIEHLTAPAQLARESFRVLKPGGLLVLSTPNSAFWLYRLFGLLGFPPAELQHPKHLQFFSRRSLRRVLADAGFAPVEEFGRNMYALLPPLPHALAVLLPRLGFRREDRFRTKSHFWHLSARSRVWNSLLADTLICVMRKPADPA